MKQDKAKLHEMWGWFDAKMGLLRVGRWLALVMAVVLPLFILGEEGAPDNFIELVVGLVCWLSVVVWLYGCAELGCGVQANQYLCLTFQGKHCFRDKRQLDGFLHVLLRTKWLQSILCRMKGLRFGEMLEELRRTPPVGYEGLRAPQGPAWVEERGGKRRLSQVLMWGAVLLAWLLAFASIWSPALYYAGDALALIALVYSLYLIRRYKTCPSCWVAAVFSLMRLFTTLVGGLAMGLRMLLGL